MTLPPGTPLPLFYPIVPDAGWVARLIPLGVRLIQLRIKGAPTDEIRRQIAESLAVARRHGCTLVVNDHWREAVALGAPFVHLGQEDLASVDLAALKAAGVRVGISTHSEAELATALAAAPDYVALGPIYETKLKAMAWAPQGLARLAVWKARTGALPLVAIGGLTLERAPGAVAAGADCIAAVTDIVASPTPEARVRAWLSWAEAETAAPAARKRPPGTAD